MCGNARLQEVSDILKNQEAKLTQSLWFTTSFESVNHEDLCNGGQEI